MMNQSEREQKILWQKLPPTCTKVRLISQLPDPERTNSGQPLDSHSLFVNKKKNAKSKTSVKIPLHSFLNRPTVNVKCKEQLTKEIYQGNTLDSSLPVRNAGKHREVPKMKPPTKLKQNILKHESEQSLDSLINYCDNIVTDGLNEAASTFLKKIVAFQEQSFKKDPDKAKIRKRYIVGFHETKKYILVKKVKILIIATNMRVNNIEELLYKNIMELKELAIENKIPYVFALSRSKLGNITMKYRPVGCVGVLNYHSAEDELECVFNNISKIDNPETVTSTDQNVYEELLDKLKDAIL